MHKVSPRPTSSIMCYFLIIFKIVILTSVRWYLIVFFYLHVPKGSIISFIFPWTYWVSVCLLEINVYSTLLLIFNQFFWQSNCMLFFFLYILDMNSLSDVWFANIFSHLVGCIFILSVVSFTLKKLFSLL